jgi:tripeptidyl-peptidase-2
VDQYSTLPPEDEDGPLGGASYYFSSRGPTPDGSNPDICAPGGAISPIPRHALQGKAQYHGTSMSSPNACGVAACILSALKLKGVDDCGPIELRRGLVNSATTVDIDDTFAQGSGLISAVGAVDYIVKNHGKEGQNLAIDVTIPSRNNARGVYIRDAIELEGPMTFGVLVQPRFDHAIKRSSEEMDELLGLELDLELKPSQPWVKCPESMTLLSAQERNGQTFSVRVDPTELGPGAHFGTIDAIDKSDPARGVLFSVPVTVIVPHSQFTSEDAPRLKINDEEYVKKRSNGLDFSMAYKLIQGVPNRRFFTAPQGAEWATIKLRSTGPNPSGKSPQNVLLHAIPFVRGDIPNTRIQLKRVFQVKEGVEQEYHMRVKGGATLELCLQLLWLANPSPTSIIADVEFHSLNACTPTLVATQPITIAAATEFARLGASAPLRSEKLTPHASLKFVERAIRPDKYDIKSGSTELDILPLSDAESRSFDGNQSNDASSLGSQIYEMRLDYKFKIEGDKPIAVTPSIPSLFNQLYDSPLDSQLWVLKDSNSRVLGFGGAMHHADSVSLKKGDYNMSLLLRHPNRSLLEALKDIPCQISLDLPSPLVCKVYGHLDKASTPSVTNDGRSPLGTIRLQKGSHQDLYVSRPTESLPAWISHGDSIVGTLNLDKGNAGGTAMKLVYAVPPKAKTKKASDSETSNDDDKEDITMTDTIFKAKLSYLASIRTKDNEAYKKLAADLKKENSTSIPLFTELLTFARKAPLPSDETNEQEWRAKELEQVYNSLKIDNDGPVDEAALAQYFGLNQPDKDELEEDKEAKKLKEDMEDQKKILQKTLFARASILGEIASGGAGVDDFDKSVKEMKKWVGAKDLEADDKIQLQILLARHANICLDKKATALSILLKARKDLPEDGYKDITNEIMKIYESFEDMNHLFENANDDIHDRFPVLNTLL